MQDPLIPIPSDFWTGFKITDLIVAIAAVFAAGFAFLQWKVYVRQANIAETTRDIANTALGRPHLFVESVSHNLDEWREGRAGLSFKFRIVNYGAGPAIVTTTIARAFLSRGPKQANRKGAEEVSDILEFPAPRDLWAFITNNPSVYSVTEIPISSSNALVDTDGRPVIKEFTYIEGRKVPRWRNFVIPLGKDAGLFASDVNVDWLNIRRSSAEITQHDTYLHMVTSQEGGVRPWLLGQIVYVDTLGRRYHTNFCGFGICKGEVIESEDAPYNERT